MTWLAQTLVPKRQAAAHKLRDSYAWHQALWTAFPGRDGQPRDFLFRLDDRGPAFRVLMLGAECPSPPDWGQWQVKQVAPAFLEHERYRFQLKANPTMRRRSDRRRIALYDEAKLRDWMHRKAEQAGFQIDDLIVGAAVDELFTRNGQRGKHVAVDFQGLLCVADRERFRDAFRRGIGAAKAFGFGMLLLQPVG